MQHFQVLGLMSGTSLDGLDLAHCQFYKEEGNWQFSIGQTHSAAYDENWSRQLKNAIHLSEEAHAQLHLDYGKWLGQQAGEFIQTHQLEVDFIASHGHTSHHRPSEGITFQLGHGQALADASGHRVLCDFRTRDVQLGGQGAPLVPIGDALLFPQYDFCLNLGGISNISFEKDGQRIAYDIGMANMPLNALTKTLGLPYDDGGEMAKKGTLNPKLLGQLNQLEYYALPYPKSTGYEWFLSQVEPLINRSNSAIEDLLHTFIHHNSMQIARAISEHRKKERCSVLVTGGGALNTFFVSVLKDYLGPEVSLIVPERKLLEFKEAMVFAFMGVLRTLGQTNVLSSVTGATSDSCSGSAFAPRHTP